MTLYRALRPVLFALPPERAHAATLALLSLVGRVRPLGLLARLAAGRPVHDPVSVLGLELPNRVGLAAGYDKDATAVRGLARLGFGHVEVGTVTPRPQPGNERPRVFRLPRDRALVNRLGFPSAGAHAVADRLRAARPLEARVGVNIGKQRSTPVAEAADDYVATMEILAPVADYLAINVSSPNTPELRRLESAEGLARLLETLVERRDRLATDLGRPLPLVVKLSPDLPASELASTAEVLRGSGIEGVMATNTTVSRPEGLCSRRAGETGGLSGAPLRDRSTAVVARLHELLEGELPLIGVGGICGGADALDKRAAGAELVQLYTGLLYRGPRLVHEVAAALAAG